MKKLALAAAALILLSGCAHRPMSQDQVNRAAKSDKYVVVTKKPTKAEQPTPNQTIKKRWYDGFRVRWLHK